jgi:hypothetical protein
MSDLDDKNAPAKVKRVWKFLFTRRQIRPLKRPYGYRPAIVIAARQRKEKYKMAPTNSDDKITRARWRIQRCSWTKLPRFVKSTTWRRRSFLGLVLQFTPILAAFRVFFRSRGDAALEIVALRQQVAVLKRRRPRPTLNSLDRRFWTTLRRVWPC